MNFMDGFWFGLGRAASELLMGLGAFAVLFIATFLFILIQALRDSRRK